MKIMKTKRNIYLLALTAIFALVSSLVTVAQEDAKTQPKTMMGAESFIFNNQTDNDIKLKLDRTFKNGKVTRQTFELGKMTDVNVGPLTDQSKFGVKDSQLVITVTKSIDNTVNTNTIILPFGDEVSRKNKTTRDIDIFIGTEEQQKLKLTTDFDGKTLKMMLAPK